jgi:AcrR family transcriptional regulator
MTGRVPSPHKIVRRATLGGLGAARPRQDRSSATRQALVGVARELFATQGFVGTSLDEIVAGAEVTKGALYHHFRGKQDLYAAVVTAVEDDARERVRARVADVVDPWERALVGLREFLAVVRTEEYRRIVILEGPAVLGYERFREQEESSTFGLVSDIVGGLLAPYDLPDSTLTAFTRLFLGAVSATGSSVSLAADPQQASDDAEGAIVLVLAGIRSLLDSAEQAPTAADLAPGLAEGGSGSLRG